MRTSCGIIWYWVVLASGGADQGVLLLSSQGVLFIHCIIHVAVDPHLHACLEVSFHVTGHPDPVSSLGLSGLFHLEQ